MAQEEIKTEDSTKKWEESEKKAAEYLAGWQRARADLLNYKKEEMERMGELLEYAKIELVLKLLPVLDNFEIAARQNPEQDLDGQEKNKQVINGFLQIKNQIEDFLKNQGLEEIKSVGEKFDPNFHEVVEEVGEVRPLQAKESGVIIEEIQKGYTINGRLLRPAKVKVAK